MFTAAGTETLTITITQDFVVEGDESFTVTIANPPAVDGYTVGTPSVQTVTIDDDDGNIGCNVIIIIIIMH